MKASSQIIVLISAILTSMTSVLAQSPREQVMQMIEQLQRNPSDTALREKVIKLAQEVHPAISIPDKAIELEGRAQFAFKYAKSESDYLAAAREYEGAIAAAPWVSGYYSDLCTIFEKAGRFEDAKRNCELYLIGLADPAHISDVKRRIAGLKFGIEKVATEKRRETEEANSPRGRAASMLSVLRKQYAGPVDRLLICGVNSNQYWKCTDDEARGTNWVSHLNVNAVPKPGVGPVQYKIVGTESDQIKIELGTYSWPNGQLLEGGYRSGCAKPNGADPNSMIWINCPGWKDAGRASNVTVLFSPNANGVPVIEYRDGSCEEGCRRAQFILKPNQ